MSNFVVSASRTGGQLMVSTPHSTAPQNAARRTSLAHYENHAIELNAIDITPSTTRTRGTPNPYIIQATHQSLSMARRDATSFTAQRLAQETGSDSNLGAQLPTAIAAYLKARDSNIEIQSSFQALDIRV